VDLALIRRPAAPPSWPPRSPARGRTAGFSLVEAILASLILLVVALGVLPLFTRAMASNFSGAESTSLSNLATGRAEELYQLPFDHALLTVPVGSTERVIDEIWTIPDPRTPSSTDGHGYWKPANELTDGLVQWTRQTRIRQFNINDLLTNTPTPLDGGTPLGSVHVKEIDVEVASGRANGIALGPSRSLRVRLFKAQ
jgi:type II secretory pathway pseudopilin PulG